MGRYALQLNHKTRKREVLSTEKKKNRHVWIGHSQLFSTFFPQLTACNTIPKYKKKNLMKRQAVSSHMRARPHCEGTSHRQMSHLGKLLKQEKHWSLYLVTCLGKTLFLLFQGVYIIDNYYIFTYTFLYIDTILFISFFLPEDIRRYIRWTLSKSLPW